MGAAHLSARVLSFTHEAKERVNDELPVVVEPAHFRDFGDLAAAVGKTRLLHDEIDAGRDLLADGARRQFDARHETQRRSEEHTSELQSLAYLVCRLLL